MTIPFSGVPLHELGPLVRRIEDAGYDDVWSAEATEYDGFTPLAIAAVERSGTALYAVDKWVTAAAAAATLAALNSSI